jgi:hypothetical protein
MGRLGHDRYGLQGGDWGSLISANLADLFPARLIGLHLNMVTAAPPVPGVRLSAEEQRRLEGTK